MNGVASRQRPTLKAILGNILPETCFMSLVDGAETVACGLGVLEGPYIGLFDIVTHPARRGQGLGTKLIHNILSWARARGAQTAYLQVMLENGPALRLYDKLGFKELYQYWYRVPS
jgi:ribosomal protein S18 acetylase RimI-like enzyme